MTTEPMTTAEQSAYDEIYRAAHGLDHSMVRLLDGETCRRCEQTARAVIATARPHLAAESGLSPLERIRAATTGPNGEHLYLSTSCWPHEQHEHCRSAINIDGGPKQGGTCKWGPERCICECHQIDTEGDPR